LESSTFFQTDQFELFLILFVFVLLLWLIWSTIRYYKAEKRKLKHLHRFAKEGDHHSQKMLAKHYQKGEMVKKSCQSAAFWYQQAAFEGDEDAKGFLEHFYENHQKKC